MSVIEARTFDMSATLLRAYELGDLINGSREVREYLDSKAGMAADPEAQRLIHGFQRKKQLFEECERFGHFHPDYHRALDEARAFQEELDRCEAVSRFRKAEERLEELLHDVAKAIAFAVSDTIKVPSGKLEEDGEGCSSCGSGGCSGGCG